jgi:hypothetical protein
MIRFSHVVSEPYPKMMIRRHWFAIRYPYTVEREGTSAVLSCTDLGFAELVAGSWHDHIGDKVAEKLKYG